jgi:uncharacterized protein (TIGR02246 family)
MNKYGLIFALLAAGAAVAIAGLRDQPAKENPTPATLPIAAAQQPAKAPTAEAGIKAITAEYQKAFNAADAKAAAMLWTVEGEYVPIEGDIIIGRAELEKSLAEYFKAHPKATAEVEVKSVRVIGRGTASAEGVVRLKLPGNEPVVESRYTALHVLEDGKWLAASVREWVPDPATSVTPKDIEWLIGEWTGKGEGGELKITYTWDENKVFLNGKYTITKDGKTVSSGTQVIGANPLGGLRSWMFDSSGTTSDSVWVRDDKRWISDALGLLPDGTEIISTNVIVPLGPDAFTWQTTEREADGVPLPPLPPIKITRVKK